jgi:two-component system, NarL family, response regulator NreC
MAKLRIVLADDHVVVRAGLKALIDGQPDMVVIGESSDGAEVLEQVEDTQPDVVVMDLSMPRLSGADATRQLHARHPEIQILMLTVHEDATYLRRVLEAGATGYVLKRAAAESLITAIRQVAAGQVYLDPALGATLVHTMMGGEARAVGEPTTLSERETLVLRLIAHGYSNKEIAMQLHLSVKTVETYKARALEKLGISSRVEIVRYASTRGWLTRA